MLVNKTPLKRISLGTVQFGISYGIANQGGRVSREEAERILIKAHAAGINTLDTASSYGESENVLGNIGINDWHVVSKLPPLPKDCLNVAAWVFNNFSKSQKLLRQKEIYGLLLHRPLDLLSQNGNSIYNAMCELKAKGVVEKIGFSIYSPSDLEALWGVYQPDIVQIPFNVFDRRMKTTGWLEKMRTAGVEIHSRSAFLQGLLLMNEEERPSRFNKWSDLWLTWHAWLAEQNLTPLQASLNFALSQPEIDRVVVGVDNTCHLDEILAIANREGKIPPLTLSTDDENLINPSLWNSP